MSYHPDYALLTAYAEGGLDSSHGLAVAAHLEICPHCRDTVHEIEAELGEVLHQEAALALSLSADSDWQTMFDAIVELPQQPATVTKMKCSAVQVNVNGKQIAIPKVLACLVKPEQQWRSYGGKVFSLPLQSEENVRMNLMYICQGVAIPEHTHKGFESTLVLHGGFTDENGHYDVGDFIQHDGKVCHSPSTPQDQDCLCLTVLTEPMLFTQGVARIFNLFGKGLYP
ncbi:transcriptional regulator [Vibrio mimicus]|uniref:ChrR family anti-sigma-E factor n=1 Tax=Vibrio mimicus TaxID=674 RepID=UPI0011DB7227|nr:ChrR family anti-sigma-E factor [Vibrio mimicus]TXY21405.1 transcriptional regulator [Vibrio mimicus]